MAQNAEKFHAFYWGVIRVVHRGCPFIELAKRLNLLVYPQIIEVPESQDEPIPFYAVLDGYFIADDLLAKINSNPLPNLEVHKISPDFERQRTLLMGTSLDEVLNAVARDPRLRENTLYAKPDFEYLAVQAMDRNELEAIRDIFQRITEKLKGEAVLDTVGKVGSLQEFLFWQRSIAPEPSAVPGLTREETRILEAAIAYGYYQTPRPINLDELAEKLSMHKSTLAQKLRDVESKIVNDALYVQLAKQI